MAVLIWSKLANVEEKPKSRAAPKTPIGLFLPSITATRAIQPLPLVILPTKDSKGNAKAAPERAQKTPERIKAL